jgi:hypothetical protein
MMDFRVNLQITEGPMAFSFVRIHSKRGVIYFVSATGKGMRHHFHMEERMGRWKIIPVPKLPDLILNV